MCALDSVGLTPLMELTSGGAQIAVGLIDGPVVKDHPDLVSDHIREVAGKFRSACSRLDSAACRHGTFVAGILSAKRSSSAPAICPGCTLLVRPIFSELTPANGGMPTANPEELAEAILDCVNAGAHVLNISAAIAQPSSKSERILAEALDHAARRGAVIVAAAGNQATMSSTIITGHPWVIPIAACDLRGKPLNESNLGHSIGRHGLGLSRSGRCDQTAGGGCCQRHLKLVAVIEGKSSVRAADGAASPDTVKQSIPRSLRIYSA